MTFVGHITRATLFIAHAFLSAPPHSFIEFYYFISFFNKIFLILVVMPHFWHRDLFTNRTFYFQLV